MMCGMVDENRRSQNQSEVSLMESTTNQQLKGEARKDHFSASCS